MDDRAERAWKWFLRGLGVLSFFFLLGIKAIGHQDPGVQYFVLTAGLLGLPNVISYQLKINREQRSRNDDEDDDGPPDPDDSHKKRHGYVP
jgi:hypothetical protein